MTNALASSAPPLSLSGTATTVDGQEVLARFLTARGLCAETAGKHGFNALAGYVEIPYVRDGQTIYTKRRGITEKTFSCDAGHTPFLWNIDVLKDESLKNEPLIITEGEFDALAAIQARFPRAVSVPNGAPPTVGTASLAYLDEVESLLRQIPEIILAVDSDEKGQNLLHDLAARLDRPRCKSVKYPKDCKDLNDALRLYGEKGVQEAIRRAQWLVRGGRTIKDIPVPAYNRPYSIGIPGFENHLNIRMADFSVVTGIPGHGKTAFVTDLTSRLAKNHGFKVAFASFEQSPHDHRRALRTWHGGKLEKNMTPEEKAAADDWIGKHFLFINPEIGEEPTLEWLIENMLAVVLRDRANVIVIDPWNEITHQRSRDTTLTEYVGDAIRLLKRFAMRHQVHVMVVAHPAKLLRSKDGKYPIPTLYDISDSQHWYNKADLGVIVHRGENGDSVIVAKSRYHSEIGKPGVIDVRFSTDTARYMVVDNGILNGQRGRA